MITKIQIADGIVVQIEDSLLRKAVLNILAENTAPKIQKTTKYETAKKLKNGQKLWEKVKELTNKGWTPKEISEKLGVNMVCVYNKLNYIKAQEPTQKKRQPRNTFEKKMNKIGTLIQKGLTPSQAIKQLLGRSATGSDYRRLREARII